MIEHGWGEHMYYVAVGMDSDEVVHNKVDGGGPAEFPRNCWGYVAP